MNEESIFAVALEKQSPGDRRAYLDQACAGRPELRAQVEALLAANAQAGSFLNHAPAGLGVTLATAADDDTVDARLSSDVLPLLQPCDKPGCLGQLDHYEIIEMVGQGGMGTVLRAFDTKLSRVVAVKVMSPALAANPTAVKRFLREAKSAAAIHHDHIVTIHNVQDDARPPYLVMQFIEGQTLQQKIDQQGALELTQILRIGHQIAAGLAAAHAHGLVHRDVKPANILLENGVERVKITDFGLARAADDLEMTQTGVIAGTPQYMSPEQAKGEPIDARSDLFSLGSVLYTMAAGRPAFRAETTLGVLRRVCDDAPRPLHEVNAAVPNWLEAIIGKLLAKSPANRFATAAEVAELLRQHLAHEESPMDFPRPPSVAPLHAAPPKPQTNLPSDSSVAVVIVIAASVLIGLPLLIVVLALGAYFMHASDAKRPNSVLVEENGIALDPGPLVPPAPLVPSATAGSPSSAAPGATAGLPSSAVDEGWMTAGLPPLLDPAKPPPFEITGMEIKRNHVEQEILRAEYRRDSVIRTLAAEVKLVILPARGGRYACYADQSITISPRASGSIHDITGHLLDYRGELPGGARVYLEMRVASPIKKHEPVRISKVFWFGTAEQLAAARKAGQPPAIDVKFSTSPPTSTVAANEKLPAGAPLWLRVGGRWQPATLWTAVAGGADLPVLVFLARPGGLYLPWQVVAKRENVHIETVALDAARKQPEQFAARLAEFKQALSRMDAPRKLVPVGETPLAADMPLLMFGDAGLTPLTALGPAKDGVVRVQDSWLRREVNREVEHLYLDPDPPPAKKTEAAPIADQPAATTPAPVPPAAPAAQAKSEPIAGDAAKALKPVAADETLKVGEKLRAQWGGKWWEVEVLEVVDPQRVKIRWIGWGDSWDEVRAITGLSRLPPPVAP